MKKVQHWAVISNIWVEAFLTLPMQNTLKNQIQAKEVEYILYREYKEQRYQSYLKETDVIIVWLNLEAISPVIHNGDVSAVYKTQMTQEVQQLCWHLAEDICKGTNAKIYWFLFEDYFLHLPVIVGHRGGLIADELNYWMQKELSPQITFIDLKYLIAEVGIEKAFSMRNKCRWDFPYTKVFAETVVGEVSKHYLIERGITKKCLILDCDNVLWGGILSEDGIENIRLSSSGMGREYQEFQRFILSLYYRGVLLAVCSKNDLDDVLFMFREHNGMILKEKHIACFQVNWGNKIDNIRMIADSLNISMESMVFVDDSIDEIKAVNAILPEITALHYQRESMYPYFSCFNLSEKADLPNIIKRNETYKTNTLRNRLRAEFDNYDEYLNALEMELDIHVAYPVEYARMAELTQRTNRCTNGKRYTPTQIKERAEKDNVYLCSVFLKDRYSDLGLVGVFEVEGDTLELFSLSCRALGRYVEKKILYYIKANYRIKKIEFQTTDKNECLKLLLQEIFNEVNI